MIAVKKINVTFGEAVEALKQKEKITRSGWNGKDMYIFIKTGKCPENSGRVANVINGVSINLFDISTYEDVTVVNPVLCMRTAQDTVIEGWSASQTDILAEDWCILK